MDDKTKTMIETVGAGLAKKVLMLQATALVSHGLLGSNYTEVFVSLGMAAVGAGWSLWNDFGKAIFISQLEVLKAKSLAQAQAMRQGGVAPVTTAQIANQSPTLTAAEVAKTVDTLPPAIQANVIKVAVAALLLAGLAFPGDASAQAKFVKPTGNIVNDIAAATGKTVTGRNSSSAEGQTFPCDVALFTKITIENVVNTLKNCVGDLANGLAKPLAQDLQDSLDSANASNDGTAKACYAPALALAQAAQGTPGVPAVTAADGTETTPAVPARPPGPILIFQKYREFVTAGGPSNCKTAVQSTINGTLASVL